MLLLLTFAVLTFRRIPALTKKKHTAKDTAALIDSEVAFREVYELYSPAVFRLCYHLSGDRELAGEIVQEVFLYLWKNRAELRITGTVESYLIGAAKLKLLQYYRNNRTREKHTGEAAAGYDTSFNNAENNIRYKELQAAVDKITTTFPDQCQRVYLLSREAGLSNKEIASHLSISVKTVEGHLTRALRLLKNGIFPIS